MIIISVGCECLCCGEYIFVLARVEGERNIRIYKKMFKNSSYTREITVIVCKKKNENDININV